ncbi:protein rep [Bacteroides pyogenes]|nr:protein rep [Bacteroides pyogenes]
MCSSIQIAMLIKGYAPQLIQLNEPYFVTLTAPTVPAEELQERIVLFGKAFRQIVTNHRARKMGMKGIRKAECTVRPKGLYHYHFHVIIGGKANAEFLVKRWLEVVPGALPQSQDLRPANEGSYIELFKYFTKLVVKDKRTGAKEGVDYKHLDIIFQTLRGKRTFQPFSGLKPVSEDIDEEELEANILISADSIFK